MMSNHSNRFEGGSFVPLTRREREVLLLLARGASAKRISHLLELSPRTVEVHAASIIRKLGARNRVHAVALAVHAGLVRPDLPLGPSSPRDGRIASAAYARGNGHASSELIDSDAD